jgi:hypothetical protein
VSNVLIAGGTLHIEDEAAGEIATGGMAGQQIRRMERQTSVMERAAAEIQQASGT